jgi:4-hydroxy-tetrahydrodipicolinate reductase
MKTPIAIYGACGRMGRRVIALAQDDPELQVVAAVEGPGHAALGRDAGEVAGAAPLGVAVTAEIPLSARPECVIDFSSPAGTMAVVKTCVDRKFPLVVATTGHEPEQKAEIEHAAHQTAILYSPNLSLVVNLLFKLTRFAAEKLAGKGFDVEIIERHHRLKKDAPSGTAVQFARVVQQEMGQLHLRHGREGLVGERPAGEIGLHAVRAGDNVGEHTILFCAPGESLELVHKATSRDSYALGALQAARFLAGKPAGRYSMDDVLGL